MNIHELSLFTHLTVKDMIGMIIALELRRSVHFKWY